MRRDFTRGASVRIRFDDGTVLAGQVWDEAEPEGRVWVALDDGRYALVVTHTGRAQLCDALGVLGETGKVAA